MTTAELVKKLMDAGADSDVVQICLEALEEATTPKKRIRRRNPAEVVSLGRVARKIGSRLEKEQAANLDDA